MFRTCFLHALAIAGLAFATAPPAPAAAPAGAELKTAGIRMIPVEGGKYKVWTKRVGPSQGKAALKVLLLHGGPGATHEYFECFEDFLPQEGIEFYYYDQLGSHYSDQPADDALWTVARFTDEVETVRKALGLENFVLLGHSWGGMLAIEYALKYPQHLRGLVISDMTAGIPEYQAYVLELKKQLPAAVQAVLEKYEAKADYQNPEYLGAMMGEVYTRHLCRLQPWPDAVERTFKHFADRPYNVLQGPNEFVITGRFKDWSRWKDLPAIKTPTLVLGAKYDEMNPEDIRRMGRLIPHATTAIMENGSHLCMWDDQAAYFKALLGFLKPLRVKD